MPDPRGPTPEAPSLSCCVSQAEAATDRRAEGQEQKQVQRLCAAVTDSVCGPPGVQSGLNANSPCR